LRRSRDRFKGENGEDRQFALATLREVLVTLSKVMAPFTPFVAEKIWQEVGGQKTSVHLEIWPEADEKLIDEKALVDMILARKVVELGLAARAEAGIKVKQPLQYIRYQSDQLSEQLEQIVADELNVKEVKHIAEVREQTDRVVKEDAGIRVGLSTTISEELRNEGLVREFIRLVNQKRKELDLTVSDRAAVSYWVDSVGLQKAIKDNEPEIARKTLAQNLLLVPNLIGDEGEVGGDKITVKVEGF